MSKSKQTNNDHSDSSYAKTPVEKLREAGNGSEVTITQWENEHDVFGWLLPLRHRTYNPVEAALTVADELAAYTETAKTFTRQTMGIGEVSNNTAIPILRAHGVTPIRSSGKRTRYLNPNYCHYSTVLDSIEDTEQRIAFYEKYAPLGTNSKQWIANHFDITVAELNTLVNNHLGRNPQDDISNGKRKLTRTVMTIREWTDRSFNDLCHAIGVPSSTFYDWRQQWVNNTEWNPPKRPVGEPWFDPTHSLNQTELNEIQQLSDTAVYKIGEDDEEKWQ